MKTNYSGKYVPQMKHVILSVFIIVALASHDAIAQETVSIGLTKMSVLYRMVENPATIAVSGVSQNDVKAVIDNGSIRVVDKGYSIIPARLGKAVVTVSVKDKIAGTVEFRVKDLPSPVAKVNGHGNATVAKGWLLKAEGITPELEGCDFDYRFKVVSFSVTTINKVGIQFEQVSNSDKFTKEQLDLINKVESGAKIRIENIKVIGPEGSFREPLPDITFTVE